MIFDITEYKDYYKVSWGKYITSLDVMNEKLPKFVSMVSKHLKGNTAVFGGTQSSLHITASLFDSTPETEIANYIRTMFVKRYEAEIVSVYYESRQEAEAFADDLEKRYIIDILKK